MLEHERAFPVTGSRPKWEKSLSKLVTMFFLMILSKKYVEKVSSQSKILKSSMQFTSEKKEPMKRKAMRKKL